MVHQTNINKSRVTKHAFIIKHYLEVCVNPSHKYLNIGSLIWTNLMSDNDHLMVYFAMKLEINKTILTFLN